MLERIREKLYELDVIMPLKNTTHGDGSICWELEWYSPAGEDCIWCIDGATEEQFANDLRMYSEDFDGDEHVKEWIPQMGKGGCPDSIRELCRDADAIEQKLIEISDAIYEMVFDVKTIGEICASMK